MPKLSAIRLYKTENVPEHILQEVENLMGKMIDALHGVCDGQDVNIILSAFNRLHAAMICTMMTKNGLTDAAKAEAICLIRNIEHISGQKVMENEGDK